MKKRCIDLILHSKTFDAHEKWAMVRYLKDNDVAEEDLKKIESVFSREAEIVASAEKLAEDDYLQKLEAYNAELDRVIHEVIPEKMRQAEATDRAGEDPDLILKDLDQIDS